MKQLRFRFLVLLVFATSVGRAFADRHHYVFAHYMVCFATYGENIQGYQREIQEAQAAGLDGFVLNVGAWDNTQAYYRTRVALIYDAAEQMGTGFKLFFSVDFENATNVVNMVETYANRTSTFRYQNRIVLSSYGHNDVPSMGLSGMDWTNSIIGKLNHDGHPAFFVPYFFSDPVQELPCYTNAVQVLNKYVGIVDGLFYFGGAGLPQQLAQCNSNYTLAVHQAGKISMASMSPHYWGCAQMALGRRYFETDGGEGLATQWRSIIATQPDWVEITTWNDFNESTYLCPVDNPGNYFSGVQSPRRFCHSGYLELSKHYINWYKTGTEPVPNKDQLFYFYRAHPRNVVASSTNDVPVTTFVGNVQDTLYTTVFLTAPADLEIATGGRSTTNSFTAGWHNLKTPFSPGSQKFTIRRNGFAEVAVQGTEIQGQVQLYDFFPESGFVYYKPEPPVNVRPVGP